MAYLIRATFDWFGGRGRRHERRISLELDDHMLRDIGIMRAEYHFLPMTGPSSAAGAGEVPDERSRPQSLTAMTATKQQESSRSAAVFSLCFKRNRIPQT